jgi:hypothetical protein
MARQICLAAPPATSEIRPSLSTVRRYILTSGESGVLVCRGFDLSPNLYDPPSSVSFFITCIAISQEPSNQREDAQPT